MAVLEQRENSLLKQTVEGMVAAKSELEKVFRQYDIIQFQANIGDQVSHAVLLHCFNYSSNLPIHQKSERNAKTQLSIAKAWNLCKSSNGNKTKDNPNNNSSKEQTRANKTITILQQEQTTTTRGTFVTCIFSDTWFILNSLTQISTIVFLKWRMIARALWKKELSVNNYDRDT